MRIWRGRHSAPLIIIWAVALGLAALMYRIENSQPAFSELFRPVYAVIFGVALIVTWKWFRARTGEARTDRRQRDRRRSDRRDDGEDLE
jgi:hypothetical protein